MTEENKDSVTQTDDKGKDLSHESRPTRTPQEIAAYNLKKQADEARKVGIDPNEVLGLKVPQVDEELADDTPLTVGTFKKMQKEESKKTALQLADEIEDEYERGEVKKLLETRLTPSGDPKADYELARSAVNAVRTAQVVAEAARKATASRTASGGSVPANQEEKFEPTEEESVFMRPPYSMSKEKILAARKKAEEKG